MVPVLVDCPAERFDTHLRQATIVTYVDLNRTFVPVNVNDPVSPEGLAMLARRYHALTWPELLTQTRVVVLAEAGSGKTEEFRQRAAMLSRAGKDAFFAALEQVAELGLETTLGVTRTAAFAAWRQASRPGWLFLDSVDEAKLQRHSFEKALASVAATLGEAAARISVLVSCRGTDWDPERDLGALKDHLPPPAAPAEAESLNPDVVLVSVVDRETRRQRAPEPSRIVVYSLTNLSSAQQRAFLIDRKVEDLDAFEAQVRQRGMEPLAERPGDLAMLVAAWTSPSGFTTLRDMLETHLTLRLRERGERPDAEDLTDDEAREDAERVAAAMTLGKVLTMKSPTDPNSAKDALDPADILTNRLPRQRAALLRRSIFTPSTYGRVRFHHRSALEYLTAAWFRRLLEAGRLAETDVLKVFRRSACGVDTVPPSLRPAAAWLAPYCPALMQVLLADDPLSLIAFGDPSGLPLAMKRDLLTRFADKHARGEVSHEFIDQHALWMFADKALAEALRDAWERNTQDRFRFELLRLIDVGGIIGCDDLVRAEALNPDAADYNRIVAARAMAATDDTAGMAALVNAMLAEPTAFGPRLAPQLVVALFPKILSIPQVLTLIDKTPSARAYQVEGFGYVLAELFGACLTQADRAAFLGGIAALCTQPPLVDHKTVSNRHRILAERVGDLARAGVLRAELNWGAELIALLQVAASADQHDYGEEKPSLAILVRQRSALNRALFWADIAVGLKEEPDVRQDPQIWRLRWGPRGHLWTLDRSDLGWLEAASRERADEAERRVALSAVYELQAGAPDSTAALDALAACIADDLVLAADLTAHRTPRKPLPMERKWRLRERKRQRKEAAQKAASSQAWRKLKADLISDTSLLTDLTRLKSWPGPQQLWWLTTWLSNVSDLESSKAPTEWRALKVPFGDDVADAYATGMRQMWRITPPERPAVNGDGRTFKHAVILAVGGLNLESSEPGWLAKLDPSEAVAVAEHVCQDDQTLPEWLNDLLHAWPTSTAPRVVAEIEREWAAPTESYGPFLVRAENSLTLAPPLRAGLLALVDREPARLGHIGSARHLLQRAQLSEAERAHYARLTDTRLGQRRRAEAWDWRMAYLALLFELDIPLATKRLRSVLSTEPKAERRARAEQAVGDLFGMRGGSVYGLERADTAALEALLRLTYEVIQPADDLGHDGSYTPERRDEAQTGRNRVLTALIGKGGALAHAALLRMVNDGLADDRKHRFRQIAWEVAETASDAWAWSPSDVRAFEDRALSPIKSGSDLLALAMGAVEDITFHFQNGDFSSRDVLETALGEFAVQNWLAEQLQLRTKGLAIVTLENRILHNNRLDIVLTAMAGPIEVALELKHGEKAWTLPDLRKALREQLAEDYLRAPNRRHGLFVVTNHRATRFWRDPESQSTMSFAEVIAVLQTDAAGLLQNSVQPIQVEVRGIDAAKPDAPRKRPARSRRSRPPRRTNL